MEAGGIILFSGKLRTIVAAYYRSGVASKLHRHKPFYVANPPRETSPVFIFDLLPIYCNCLKVCFCLR